LGFLAGGGGGMLDFFFCRGKGSGQDALFLGTMELLLVPVLGNVEVRAGIPSGAFDSLDNGFSGGALDSLDNGFCGALEGRVRDFFAGVLASDAVFGGTAECRLVLGFLETPDIFEDEVVAVLNIVFGAFESDFFFTGVSLPTSFSVLSKRPCSLSRALRSEVRDSFCLVLFC
jgi:hypothetical protein